MKRFVTTLVIILATTIGLKASTNVLAKQPQKKDIVFIAGFDEGDNTYYTNAKSYFNKANYLVVDDLYALTDILNWLQLHYDKALYNAIHIVSHSNPWHGLSLKTNTNGERITVSTLQSTLKSKNISPLEKNLLANDTKIIFHSCGLGKNKTLLQLLKKAITTNTMVKVYASEAFNVFGGKYANHYIAKTYYGYYPTAQSPGPRQLAKEFKAAYPSINANWEKVLKTRTEQLSGDMYTYKFNIPVEWTFEFEDKTDIPKFTSKEDIMDWIKAVDELWDTIKKLNIPIEKFRWLSKTKGNTLIVKGKTTVLCVMQPIMQQNTLTYLPVDFENEYYVKL